MWKKCFASLLLLLAAQAPVATLGTPLTYTWWVGADSWANAPLPAAGGTIQIPQGYNTVYINTSALVSAYTVQLPAEPTELRVQIASANSITLLTVKDQNGNTIGTAYPMSPLSTAGFYLFHVASATWSRLQ